MIYFRTLFFQSMKKIAFCCIALFILQIDCFCREGNLNIRFGVSSFKHRIYGKIRIGDQVLNFIDQERKKPRIELGVGYSLNRLELGVYGSQTRVTDRPGDNYFGLYSLGINSKYHISKLLVKNKISDIIDVYVAGKFEGCFYAGKERRDYTATRSGLNYGIGLGMMISPIKVLGIYCDYGYTWYNPEKSILLNQDFLQLGICVKF